VSDVGPLPCNPLPAPVGGGLTFRSVTGGNHHTCGVTTTNVAYCWGLNDEGQLGDGSTRTRVQPERVAMQQGVP
jgi:alpha-tubulin suppressor-like RCC1 family protein